MSGKSERVSETSFLRGCECDRDVTSIEVKRRLTSASGNAGPLHSESLVLREVGDNSEFRTQLPLDLEYGKSVRAEDIDDIILFVGPFFL
jgi:hypothetical protein